MTKRERQQAAAVLERLAGAVARGEVTARAGFVARLQGEAIALMVDDRTWAGNHTGCAEGKPWRSRS